MPLVRIDMIKGKAHEYRQALLDCVHEALVESIGIAEWDRFQRISEYERGNFEIPSGKTDDFTLIEITMFQSRTSEQKKALIEMITQKLTQRLSIAPTDVFIVILDPPDENWGLGGKQRGS